MYVLYGRGCGPSGRLLAQHLGVSSGRTLTGQHDTIVQWGNPSYDEYGGARIVNTARSIRNCVDKRTTLDLISEAGLNVPPYSTFFSELELPILGRQFSNRSGRDIKLYMQRADLEVLGPSDFYVQFVPKNREFRVHVVGRRAVKLSRKEFRGTDRRMRNAVAWNYRNGFRFVRRDENTPSISHFAQIAIPAVQSLDLDFGAVDLFEGEDGLWYVTEVNSAPGLEEPSARVYARNIRRLVEGD